MFRELNDNAASVSIMTEKSHHANITIVWTTQDYFDKGKDGKVLDKQVTYRVSQ